MKTISKQAQAKIDQGHCKTSAMCNTCSMLKFSFVPIKNWKGEIIGEEKKELRCSIGGFATGRSNWCERYNRKQESS